jgi:transposase
MKKELKKILNLPKELRLEKMKEEGKEVIVFCKAQNLNNICPKCESKRHTGYDKTKIKKLHTVLNGKKIFLEIKKRRVQCLDCKHVYTEIIPGMHGKGKKTTDFFDQLVQEKSRNQDYSSVARELGIYPSTVANKQDLLSIEDKFITPKEKELYLGLDGKYLNGEEEIFVIGEVKRRQFLGVTKTNKAVELEELLSKNIVEKGKIVKVVTMDMSKLLKGVTNRLFPKAVIVVDKFHMIKYANHVIDLCRIAFEKSVNQRFEIKRILVMKNETIAKIKDKEKWRNKIKKFFELIETNHEIKILWDLKNRIHSFYLSKTKEIAVDRFNGILQFLTYNSDIHPEFDSLRKTFLNWQKEILNYFDHCYTNAFIEGLNNRIETLKRKKFGFRNKLRFIKTLVFALLPITLFISTPIFTHTFN